MAALNLDRQAAFAPEADAYNTEVSALDSVFSQAVERLFDLDDRGRRLNVEVSDVPYNALVRVAEELRQFGASNALADFIVEALEAQTIQLGADFTRKEKPTPLSIKVMVTDKRPVLDEGKTHFIVAFDRTKKLGSQYSTAETHFTNTGTKTTTTNVPDLETMFTGGGERYLVLHFEKLEADGLNGLDETGAAMVQAVEAMGAGVSAQEIEEIKAILESGEATPELAALVQNMSDLKSLQVQALEPGAAEGLKQAIALLKDTITEQVKQLDVIPQVLAKPIAQTIAPDTVSLTTPIPEALTADNDNHVAQAVEVEILPAVEMAEGDVMAIVESLEQSGLESHVIEQIRQELETNAVSVETVQLLQEILPDNVSVRDLAVAVQDMNRTMDSVLTSQTMDNVIAETIQNDPALSEAQKQEIIAAIEQGDPKIIKSVLPLLAEKNHSLATVIVRQNAEYRVSEQVSHVATKIAALPPVIARNPEIQRVLTDLKSGRVPANDSLVKIKDAVPSLRSDIVVLQVRQDKSLNLIPSQLIQKDITRIIDKMDVDGKRLEAKELRHFIKTHPDVTAKDFAEFIKTRPPESKLHADLNNYIQALTNENPSIIVVKGDDARPVLDLIKIEKFPPEMKEQISTLRYQIATGQPVDPKALSEVIGNMDPQDTVRLSELLEHQKVETPLESIKRHCDGNCPPGGCPGCTENFLEAAGSGDSGTKVPDNNRNYGLDATPGLRLEMA